MSKTRENGLNRDRTNGSPWDFLRNTPFKGRSKEEVSRDSEKKAEGEKRAIVAALLEDDPKKRVSILYRGESDDRIEEYAKALRNGEIGPQRERDVLEVYESEVDRIGAKGILKKNIGNDVRQLRLLAYMGLGDFSHPEDVGVEDVYALLEDCPLPMDFDETAEEFLAQVKANNSKEVYDDYKKAMKRFRKSIYGKRQDVYEKMTEVRRQALGDEQQVVDDGQRAVGRGRQAIDEERPILNEDYQAVDKKRMREILATLPSGLAQEGANEVYEDRFRPDKHQKRILAYVSGGDFSRPDDTNARSLEQVLELYPTPMEFDPEGEMLLRRIRQSNTPEKHREYIAAMQEFRKNVYGPRLEYYEQWKKAHPEDELRTKVEIRSLDEHEADVMMSQAIIEADPYTDPEYGDAYRKRNLRVDDLKKMDLGPRNMVKLDGVRIGLSRRFEAGDRDALIAYVETPAEVAHGYEVAVRAYYRSRSQGVWRYLPGYAIRRGGSEWFEKGVGEDSLTLPFEMQMALEALNGIGQKPTDKKLSEGEADFAFFGTTTQEGRMRKHELDVYREVSPVPRKFDVVHTGDKSIYDNYKEPPEHLTILDPNLAPDYKMKIWEFLTTTGLYGNVKMEAYQSLNKELKYVFATDTKGRSWLTSVQTDAPITSTGLRSEWVSGGDLTTPLYEYANYDGGYGRQDDRKGSYVNMWDNYLSKVPMIREFAEQHRK